MNAMITPVISVVAAGIATTLTAGSTTATSAAAFGSVLAGQKVFGPGIVYGTKVASKTNASTIILDTPANLGGAQTLQYGYFAAAAYTAGDALGWIFPIPLTKINNLFVVDKAKQITAIKLYVYNAKNHQIPPVSTPILDNAAFAPVDADAVKLVGYYSLTSNVALADNHVIFPAATELLPLPISGESLWGQLVAVGTPTFAAINDLAVNISGE